MNSALRYNPGHCHSDARSEEESRLTFYLIYPVEMLFSFLPYGKRNGLCVRYVNCDLQEKDLDHKIACDPGDQPGVDAV
jgi:hypothetical protein